MKASLSFSIFNQHLWLSPQKAVFWEEQKALIMSDLHLGKTGHFRKAGIAVPQDIFKNDLHRLFDLVQYFKPAKLIIVGDFFHSVANKEADFFSKWRHDHHDLQIELVMGNHDIMPAVWYHENSITIHETEFAVDPFRFVHEWPGILPEHENSFLFSGHIHPGIRMNGLGKQSLRLPCFYFEPRFAILPAFGGFTGLAIVSPTTDSRVFAITNQEVITLQ